MTKLRGVLTAAIFLALVGLSLGSALEVARRGLPEPFDIRNVSLQDWLTERNMRHQGRSTKRRIVAEIERQTAEGRDWGDNWNQLTASQRERYAGNWNNLTALWLRDQTEGFFRTEEAQRDAYLDKQAARIKRWWLPPTDDDEKPTSRSRRPSVMQKLQQRWDNIFAHYEPHESQRIRYYVQLVQMHGINRAFTPTGSASSATSHGDG